MQGVHSTFQCVHYMTLEVCHARGSCPMCSSHDTRGLSISEAMTTLIGILGLLLIYKKLNL